MLGWGGEGGDTILSQRISILAQVSQAGMILMSKLFVLSHL